MYSMDTICLAWHGRHLHLVDVFCMANVLKTSKALGPKVMS